MLKEEIIIGENILFIVCKDMNILIKILGLVKKGEGIVENVTKYEKENEEVIKNKLF